MNSQITKFQTGIIPIVDLGVLAFAGFRGAEDRLGARSPVLDLAREPLAFQLPVEPLFLRRGRLVYGRLRPLELEAAGPESKSSAGS